MFIKKIKLLLVFLVVFFIGGLFFYFTGAELFQGRIFSKPKILPAYDENKCLDKCKTDLELEKVLSEVKIKTAVGSMTRSEEIFLKNAYWQLVSKDTDSWKEFDNQMEFSYEEIRKIWLRRLAFSLFADSYHNLPWKLMDYPQEELTWMLSFCTNINNNYKDNVPFYGCGQYFRITGSPNKFKFAGLLEPNPQRTYEISMDLFENVNKTSFSTKKDLIDNIILGMRKIGWTHKVNNIDGQYDATLISIDDLFKEPAGSCYRNSHFIGALARSWNIPTRVDFVSKSYHGNILFLTEGIGLYHGDDVQNKLLSPLPVNDTYISQKEMESLYFLDFCEAYSGVNHNVLTNFLSYYKDPEYQSAIFEGGYGYCNKREKYLSDLVKGNEIETCDYGSDKVKLPLSDWEFQDWENKLKQESEGICPIPKIVGLDKVLKPGASFELVGLKEGEVTLLLTCDKLLWTPVAVRSEAPYEFIFDGKLCLDDACSEKASYVPSCKDVIVGAQVFAKSGKYVGTYEFGPYSYILGTTETPPA